ncbi:MAG: LanC-like protein [Betaproteobacteria bacterium]
MLSEPARHESLTATPWSDSAAQEAITQIVGDTVVQFDPSGLWPAHPLDDPPDELPFCTLYSGAAGVIRALQKLQRAEVACTLPDFAPAITGLLERNRQSTSRGSDLPSLLLGDVGILLLQWHMSPSATLADSIHGAVERNLRNPALEQLWGSPGTLLAAIWMHEWTGERRWVDLFRSGVNILWDAMEEVTPDGFWIWTQAVHGRRVRYLGAGHGFAGNVYPIFRGAHMLSADQVASFARRTAETLRATVMREEGMANWPANVPTPEYNPDPKRLLQDCHGAPGIICRLPNHVVPELDDLLIAGGELVWEAGPLAKGAGLCHGTAGNGYAFLRLYMRTGERRWLDRARAYAMHAVEQCAVHAKSYGQRRYSLWTGDLGVAMFVQSCLKENDTYPTLDDF